jgi:hypothetical protein
MVKELHLDKILYYKKKDRYELFYEKYGTPVFLQLSKGYLSKKIEDNTKFIWLGYFSNTIEKNNTFNYLTRIKNSIENSCCIQLETFFYDNGICIPCQNNKGNLQLEIYFRQNNTLWEGNLNEFPEKSYIIPVIYIENIVNRENKWRINLKLIQICVFPLYQKFGKCVIELDNIDIIDNPKNAQTINSIAIQNNCKETMVIDNDEIDNYINMKLCDHPIYSKYFKMCKMGIPKDAVIQKMKSEVNSIDAKNLLNRDPNDIEKIKLVMTEEHQSYSRFFKMIKLGVPKAAVEQKMILEGIDIYYLDKGKQLIPNIEIIKTKDIFSELFTKKLRKKDSLEKNIKDNNSNKKVSNLEINLHTNIVNKSQNNLKIGFSMEELLNKRNTLFYSKK